jgi:hypothetical protein
LRSDFNLAAVLRPATVPDRHGPRQAISRRQIASFSDCLAARVRIMVTANVAQCVRRQRIQKMCNFNDNEILIWQHASGTQLEIVRCPGTDLEIRTAQTAGQDAAVLAGVRAAKDAACTVIPIRWMPVQSWPKTIRAVK